VADWSVDLALNVLCVFAARWPAVVHTFYEMTPEMRPQDVHGNGTDWVFETPEHSGDEPDNMTQAITATDPQVRWAVYVPLARGGQDRGPAPASATMIDRPRT
jgi:hypothetical protein